MKYLRILIDPIRLKADPDDEDQLKHDLYEKIQAMIEAEVLSYTIDEEDMEEEDY